MSDLWRSSPGCTDMAGFGHLESEVETGLLSFLPSVFGSKVEVNTTSCAFVQLVHVFCEARHS